MGYFFHLKKINFSIKKSIALRLQYEFNEKSNFDSFKIKLISLAKVIISLFTFFVKLKKTSKVNFVFFSGNSEYEIKLRKYHISKNTELHDNDIEVINPVTNLYYSKLSLLTIYKIWKCHIIYIIAYLRLIIINDNRLTFEFLPSIFYHNLQLILLKKDANVYFYLLSTIPTYITAYLADEKFKMKNITVIGSNSLLYSDNRYLFLPNATYSYCTKVQKEELRIFTYNNWIKVKEINYWGLEEAIEYDKIEPVKPLFDLAIYSGGSWARDNKNFRISDEKLLASINHENLLYPIFCDIIDLVVKFKQKNEIKVKVYPHPHERNLMKKGILPPYLDTLKKNAIDFDFEGKNSIKSIYEAKIGLAVVSTIIFDRINFDLPGFVFSGYGQKNYLVNPLYMGEYADLCFDTKEGLEKKLTTVLNL